MSMACVDTGRDSSTLDQTLTDNAETRLKRLHESTHVATGPSTDSHAADKGEQAKEDHSPPETAQKKALLDSETDGNNSIVPHAYDKLRSQELLPERYVRQVLVLQPQGGLGSFTDFKQLVTAFKDYTQGIYRLREDAGIVHGNAALSHLKINKDGRGVLVDWDMPGAGNWRMK